jgi:hypothetical protein
MMIKKILKLMILIPMVYFISACQTQQTTSSSSGIPSIPSSSPSGMPSPPSSPSAGLPSPSSSPSMPSSSPSFPSSSPSFPSGQQSSSSLPSGDSGSSSSANSGDMNSGSGDDQILSEAMDVFNQSGDGQSGGQQGALGDSDVLGQTAGNSMPGDQASGSGESGGASQDDPLLGAEIDPYASGGAAGGMDSAQGEIDPYADPYASGGGLAGEEAGYPDYGSGGSGAMTSDERVGAMEEQFDEQLAQFDGMILDEQQAARASRDSGADASDYGLGGDGESAPLLTASARGQTMSNSGGGIMPNIPANRQGEFSGQGSPNQANIPTDIPDGSDDDVVARQLREAAMNESDPELRERLWDEYRKYKQGAVGR